MTTAARPTFEPARGGTGKGENDLSSLSKQYSSRDLPSHTKLKYRQSGQSSQNDLREREFRRELEEKERKEREKKEKERGPREAKRARLNELPVNLDADEPQENSDEDSDEEDDDDDDTAALLAELQKIKKERATEALKKEEEKKAEEERIRTDNIIKGNPLLNTNIDYKVKRRWDDDVVFKNCAKGSEKEERGFINDTLRSEFHKKFMDKYVK
ncbi:DgyrCDS12653 [Dimorphilus gyrociliatus]|uniref:DgyrCDS12653 n=1 Tax=Dimorphilus gyrociliatus TaxID=2664684 RepID=A0A7I8W751_9ANNE|nr:DgyrCDS12653 [Dimorphilus gyrociliatus]